MCVKRDFPVWISQGLAAAALGQPRPLHPGIWVRGFAACAVIWYLKFLTWHVVILSLLDILNANSQQITSIVLNFICQEIKGKSSAQTPNVWGSLLPWSVRTAYKIVVHPHAQWRKTCACCRNRIFGRFVSFESLPRVLLAAFLALPEE